MQTDAQASANNICILSAIAIYKVTLVSEITSGNNFWFDCQAGMHLKRECFFTVRSYGIISVVNNLEEKFPPVISSIENSGNSSSQSSIGYLVGKEGKKKTPFYRT